MIEPFVRESGNGPTVVCLHASASSSAQWRALTERLSGRFRVLAVDLHGCGRTPGWPGPLPLQLDDETTMLDPVWDRAGARFHLMGHSYGGAVAMHAAIRHVDRVASLLVYEPVMFGLLNKLEPDSMAASEINGVRADTSRFVASGHLDAAAARFGAYWLGDEAWAALTPERQAAMACAMPNVMPQWQAAFAEPPTRIEFGALSMPIQLLGGVCSTAAARAVSRLLADMLPHVFREELPGCGHMAPVTSPERVNPAIERFLATH
ncbi:alpha/beta fold hydrolase [Rhizobacter sp. Root404]|uniref:alpha/beta fold hydrolase n=1 Tax=Rhizobacter sp. Root404 TaxID=1736528 RepID=UPI00138F09F9|nr:alpha/beta hydrolase [Rhizobacter sp. Root404]